MSVYTTINHAQLDEFLDDYNVGHLLNFRGVDGGITNTNYCVTTDQGQFVLTLFEQQTADELPFYLDLLTHLMARKYPCAGPIMDRCGVSLKTLRQKPTVLIEWCIGEIFEQINTEKRLSIATALGQLHQATQDFPQMMKNARGFDWIEKTAQTVLPFLTTEQQVLLKQELAFQSKQQAVYDRLPSGIIHADLFRDNVLFEGNQVSAVLDFYYACHDYLLLDIATTINDWCADEQCHINKKKQTEFLAAYQIRRKMNDAELECLPAMMRLSALRYWLSRLNDYYFPSVGEAVLLKDPVEYENKLTSLMIS